MVQGFTPDGRKVLFTSRARSSRIATRSSSPCRSMAACEERAADPERGQRRVLAPTGGASPTTRSRRASSSGSNYRGGTVSRHLALRHRRATTIEKVPQPATRANDVDADVDWRARCISDRTATASSTCSRYDPRSNAREAAHARTSDFPVLDAVGGRRQDRLRAGRLPAPVRSRPRAATRRLSDWRAVGFARDAGALREGRSTGFATRRSRRPGARAVFEFRGEIVTVPAEKGDARNLTKTPGAHERSPAWSPDGTRDRLLLRRLRRVRAARRAAGRQGRGRRSDAARRRRLLRRSRVVARQPQAGATRTTAQSLYMLDLAEPHAAKVAVGQGVRPIEPDQRRLVARLEAGSPTR